MLRLLLTWPWPVQPGVGHFSTFSCMAKTTDRQKTDPQVRSVSLVAATAVTAAVVVIVAVAATVVSVLAAVTVMVTGLLL